MYHQTNWKKQGTTLKRIKYMSAKYIKKKKKKKKVLLLTRVYLLNQRKETNMVSESIHFGHH